jgi:hypothetical protein
MIRTKTRRKQKKHGKHIKTKKRIYGGGFLFDYSVWASKTITPTEKNEALNRINSILPNPKQPIRTRRLIKTALDELREKYYDNDIYDALDSKILELIYKKSVDLKDIFDDKNKGDLKWLTKTNNFLNAGDVEMTELSSRPLMERKTEQPIDAQTVRPPTPTVEEPIATADIGEDLGLSDPVEQSEETGTNERETDDEAMTRANEIREETIKEADAAVAKSNDIKLQIKQMIKQREMEEAIDLFDDVNDYLVEIIDTAEKQVASSNAKSAINLFNVVNKDLKTMVDAVELDQERAAAEEARQIEIQNAKTEADRIAAEERFASEKARIDAIELFGTVNGHLQTMVETVETKRAADEKVEAERVAAAEKAEAERILAEKAETERILAEKAEAERVAAEEAEAERILAEKAETERVAAEKAEAERVAAEEAKAKRVAAEKAETERVAAEEAEAERILAEKAEAERIAGDKAKSDAVSLFGTVNGYLQNITEAAENEEKRIVDEERLAAEEAERVAAEKAEAERVAAAEKAAAEQIVTDKAKSDAVSLFGIVNGYLQNMTEAAENEEKRLAEEERKRIADEETERLAAKKLEEERLAEEERERAAVQKLEEGRLVAESLFKTTNQSMESIVGSAEAESKRIALEQERQAVEAKQIAAKSLLDTVQKSLDDITHEAEIERAEETARLAAEQVQFEAEQAVAEQAAAEQARLEAERAAEPAQLESEQAAAQSLFDTVQRSLNAITGAAENTELQKEDIQSSREPDKVNYSKDYDDTPLYYPEDYDTVMPKLGSITSTDKLYVLRTVDNMVTIDPKHIYANEKSILDSKPPPLAIVPGYMVNDVEGEMTASDLLELLQSYYNYISKLINPVDIIKLEKMNDDELFENFYELYQEDKTLNEELTAEYQ